MFFCVFAAFRNGHWQNLIKNVYDRYDNQHIVYTGSSMLVLGSKEGGSRKTFDQIADIPDSFLPVDETEFGHGNRIPLWMFGMLY